MSSIKTCCCEHLWWKSISNLPDSDLEPLLFAGCYITMFHVFGVCMSFSFRFSFAAWVRKAITCKFVNPVGVAGASNPGGSTEKLGVFYRCSFTIHFCRHTDIFVCCERRAEVAISVSDQSPNGFISRCPWSRTVFVRSSTPNISNTKLDSFLCSASWLRVTQELYLLCVLCSFFVRLLTVRHFMCTKWFCEHQLQCLISKTNLQEFKSSNVK